MAATLLKPHEAARAPGRVGRWLAALQGRMMRGYRRSLRWTLRHQPLALLALAGVIALNVHLYMTIPKGFFPQQDTGLMIGGVQADQASSFQSMQQKLRTFHDIVRADPAVANVTGFTGGGQRNSANMFISLKPRSERQESVDDVINRLRGKLAKVPGANLFLVPVQDIRIGGRQSNAQYQFTLQADDLDELRSWEPRIRQAIAFSRSSSAAARKSTACPECRVAPHSSAPSIAKKPSRMSSSTSFRRATHSSKASSRTTTTARSGAPSALRSRWAGRSTRD